MHILSFSTLSLWCGSFLQVSTVVAQTPPDFSPSTEGHLIIQFGNTIIKPDGLQIGINVPTDAPQLSLKNLPPSEFSTFLFALVDPDAPIPTDPTEAQFLHWLLPGIPSLTEADQSQGNFVLDTTTPIPFVPFVNPTPPNVSRAHRYIGLLFAQPTDFSIPSAFEGFSAVNRSNFNVTIFAEEAGLGSPLFANWFLVSNQTIFDYY